MANPLNIYEVVNLDKIKTPILWIYKGLTWHWIIPTMLGVICAIIVIIGLVRINFVRKHIIFFIRYYNRWLKKLIKEVLYDNMRFAKEVLQKKIGAGGMTLVVVLFVLCLGLIGLLIWGIVWVIQNFEIVKGWVVD